MARRPDPLDRPEFPYDADDPQVDNLERYEQFGKVGPASWILGGLLGVAVLIGLLATDSSPPTQPPAQTTENVPIAPIPPVTQPN